MSHAHPIDLSQVLRARLTPVAVLVLAVVWLAIPLGWGALRVGELRATAQTTGAQVADLVRREVSSRPSLWRYDTIKLLGLGRRWSRRGLRLPAAATSRGIWIWPN